MAGNSIILHRAPVSIKKSKATLDSLLSTVERGFAAIADDITDIKSKMATKDDINSLDTKLTAGNVVLATLAWIIVGIVMR
jgi:hypothetical protein